MISVIVYGRNDSHGYNYPRRAATSMNAIAEVLDGPDDELLFVDWNTPSDFPTFPESIADTLTPRAKELLRVFRVRPEVQARYAHRTHLPVLEPIARNVALLRSHPANRWILSTNSDMVFVPRGGMRSLTEAVADLETGFWAAPRIEAPESLWESFDRMDAPGAIAALERWAEDGRLARWSAGKPGIFLYDGPGDFQLMLRDDLFAIDGFDEAMLLGWHVDSNIFKRLSLLLGGAESGDLEPRVHGYHLTHTRQHTKSHVFGGPVNDWLPFFAELTEADLPAQRGRWGLPDDHVEEIRLGRTRIHVFLDAVRATLVDAPPAPSKDLAAIDYDAGHVLPFLMNALVGVPEDATLGWSGDRPELLALARRAWRGMGFTGPILVPLDVAPALLAGQPAGDDVRPVPFGELCERADAVVFDFARGRGEDGLFDAKPTYATMAALKRFVAAERRRLARGGGVAPRQIVTVNTPGSDHELAVLQLIDTALSPESTRIRSGHARPADPAAPRPGPGDPNTALARPATLTIVTAVPNDGLDGGRARAALPALLEAVNVLAEELGAPVDHLLVDWNPRTDQPPLDEALAAPVHALVVRRMVVVDGKPARMLADALPGATPLGAARNVGIRRGRASFTLVVDPETSLAPGTGARIRDWLVGATERIEADLATGSAGASGDAGKKRGGRRVAPSDRPFLHAPGEGPAFLLAASVDLTRAGGYPEHPGVAPATSSALVARLRGLGLAEETVSLPGRSDAPLVASGWPDLEARLLAGEPLPGQPGNWGFHPKPLPERVRWHPDVLAMVHSRGRPAEAAACVAALRERSVRAEIVLAVDDDDPELDAYLAIPDAWIEVQPRVGRANALNLLAERFGPGFRWFASIPDGVEVLTPGWDQHLAAAIADDALGVAVAGAGGNPVGPVLLAGGVVDRLGCLAPPPLVDAGIEAAWAELGEALGTLRRVPSVAFAGVPASAAAGLGATPKGS